MTQRTVPDSLPADIIDAIDQLARSGADTSRIGQEMRSWDAAQVARFRATQAFHTWTEEEAAAFNAWLREHRRAELD